ncbi:MAG: DUF4347 domain-containing protein, partial [Deinococcota bacterium]
MFGEVMVYRLTASLIFLLAQLGSVQANTSEAALSYGEVPHVSHIAYNSAANNAEAEAYHNLLVIDTQLDDYETLLAQVPSSTQVLLLEPDNATTVLTEALAALPADSVNSLQIVSHGRAGALQLGDAWLTDNSAALFEAWEHALADDTSEVLLYGCELAAGQHGQMFVSGLAQTLQSNVFASDDLTGSALLQGNWSLEVGSRSDGTPLTGRSITIFEDSGYKFTLQAGDIVVIPVAPAELTVSEAGDTATFSVSLSGPRPTSNVTVGFSFDPEFLDEATTTPGEVTFTPTDFDNSRAFTITVRGLDDSLADGDTGPFPVNIGTASEDDAYNRITKTEPQIINVDNDTADVLVIAPAGGLMVSEAGDTDSFTVRLSAQPAPDTTVTVALAVRDINPNAGDPAATEATTNPTEVTFDETNWNIPNTVVVAGADDDIIDGDQNFFVDLTVTSTPESPFAGLELPSISGLNEDDDATFAGISVDPFVGVETNEDSTAANATGSFTVVLNRGPRLPVSVPIQSNDSSEGVVVPPSVLVFTPANWDQPQTVVVRGVDDDLNDGDQVYTISVGPSSSDQAVYDGIDPEDVEVTNVDDDEPGFVFNIPADPSVSEPDGALNIQVRLTVIPTEGVALPLSVSDPDRATVSPASLSFTPDNWDVFQTVTVTAIDNNIDDDLINGEPVTFDLVTGTSSSSDPDYSGLTTDDITITYIDDDVAGIRASPQSGLSTTEDGGEASFTVVLETRPTTAVTVNLGSSDTTEGAVVPPTSIVFTPDDWDEPQSVRVRGLDDNLDDGDIAYSITVEGSGEYSGVSTSVSVQNTDDDTAGVNVSPTDGLITSETGTSDVFNVVLTTTPEGSVTIDFTSSEPNEGSVEPSSVTFDSSNWNQPQTVTVTGIDDAVADGNAGYQIDGVVGQGSDAAFLGVAIPSVTVVNIDDDTPGVTVSPTSLETIEGGALLESCDAIPDPDGGDADDGDADTDDDADDSGLFAQACFRVVLNSRPQSSVTISLTSDDETEGTVSPGELAFTPVNWNEPQFVTVTAVDDGIVDADVDYTIVTSEVQSTDSDYSGLSVPDVNVTNFDNNASITVSPVELEITEAPGETMQATFEVNLDAPAPEGFEVVIDLRSSDTSQGTVSPESLRFTPADGINPKTVTVTAVNNNVQEGDTQFQIILDPAESPGNGYDGIDPADVTVVNIDDDEAGISVRALASPLVVSEDGDTAELRLVLDSEPQAEVSVPVSVSNPDEGSLSAEVIIFNEENWNIEQALIVRGVDDQRVDADTTFTVNFGTVTTSDPAYQGQTPSPSVFTVTNRDNDQAGINVTLLNDPLETDENGGSGQFTIVLASQTADSVSIDIRSSDPSEGQAVPGVVTFTADNWNVPQTVNVLGIVQELKLSLKQNFNWFCLTQSPFKERQFYSLAKLIGRLAEKGDQKNLGRKA